jgi:hypothetical protein
LGAFTLNFFHLLRKPKNSSAPATLEIYNTFIHKFTDYPDRFELVSLKLGALDLGSHARFLIPLLNPEKTLAYTWELKWAHPLVDGASGLAGGWNKRIIHMDLVSHKVAMGKWEKLLRPPLKIKPDWKEVTSILSKFSSPDQMRKTTITAVTEQGVSFSDYDEKVSLSWEDIKVIHFSKRAVNTSELPLLGAILETDEQSHDIELPLFSDHRFYKKLIEKGLLTTSTLDSFLTARDEVEMKVMSDIGGLELPVEEFDLTEVRLGIRVSHKFISWKEIYYEEKPLENVDIGGIIIDRLEAGKPDHLYEHFPAQKFYFKFSCINGKSREDEIKKEVKNWVEQQTNSKIKFNPSWSTFLMLESSVVQIHMSYDRSAGFASLQLAPGFYRQVLLGIEKFRTSFSPTLSFKQPDGKFHFAYGFSQENILPAPDTLNAHELTFWKDESGNFGLSDGGYLYLWKGLELSGISNSIADEFSDRGGPYFEIHMNFHDRANLTLRTSCSVDLGPLKDFLR